MTVDILIASNYRANSAKNASPSKHALTSRSRWSGQLFCPSSVSCFDFTLTTFQVKALSTLLCVFFPVVFVLKVKCDAYTAVHARVLEEPGYGRCLVIGPSSLYIVAYGTFSGNRLL